MLHRIPLALVTLGLLATLEGCKGCRSDTSIVKDKPADDTGAEAGYDHDWGSWLSMALMPDGRPAAAYYDRTQTGLGFAIGTIADGEVTWEHEEVDGFPDDQGLDTGDRGTYASMAIADDGTVWIASYDATNKALRYARRDPDGTWTTGVADTGGGASPDAGRYASLALDADGSPLIAHYDAGKGQLRLARYDAATGTFSGEVVDEGEDVVVDTGGTTVEADVGRFARLRIVEGVAYIAYYDAAAGDLKLAWGTPGDMTVEVVASEGDVGQWPDLVVDGDTVTIAFQDVGDQDLEVATGRPGGEWTLETVDDGETVGADTALFMNGSQLAVVYFDGHDNDIKMAWRSSEGWQVDTVAGTDAALGFHNEVVTIDGTPWVGCYDYTHRDLWFQALP